jgi:hypothetical protein
MIASEYPTPVRRPRSSIALRLLSGPVRLVKAQFNFRNAVCLVALSVPALLVTALLTLPALLFTTPQHYEYFEFAQQLDQGGERWLAVGLSACCSLLCFAVPAQGEEEEAS